MQVQAGAAKARDCPQAEMAPRASAASASCARRSNRNGVRAALRSAARDKKDLRELLKAAGSQGKGSSPSWRAAAKDAKAAAAESAG